MNSLGSNHSIPSTSVSTGSQSSSVNSMQEMLDDGCSDMTMMHPQDYGSTLESSPHTKKVNHKEELKLRWMAAHTLDGTCSGYLVFGTRISVFK